MCPLWPPTSEGAVSIPQEPFTAEEVIAVCERLKQRQDFTTWESTNENRDARRYRRWGIDIPGIPEKMEDRRPDIQYQITSFVNHFDSANLKIRVNAREDSDKAIESAQKVKNAFYFIGDDFSSQRPSQLYAGHRRAMDLQVAKGCGPRHLDFSKEIRAALFNQKLDDAAGLNRVLSGVEEAFKRNPWVIECPDLEALRWDPDLSTVAEVGEKQISALKEVSDLELREYLLRYPGFVSETMQENAKVEDVARTYHLETSEFIYDVIDASGSRGQAWGHEAHMLEFRPNLLGRPWYTLTPGNFTGSRNVGEAYEPLIAVVYPLVERLSVLNTLLNSAALQTGRIGYQEVAIGANAISAVDFMHLPDADRKTDEFSFVEFGRRNPRDGFEWKPMPVPDLSVLLEMSRSTQDEVERKGFPPVLDPSAILKAESGYDRNQISSAAAHRLDPPLRNMAASVKQHFIDIAEISSGLPISIQLPVVDIAGGHDLRIVDMATLDPDDWRDIQLQVSYESIDLGAESVRQEMNLRLFEAGFMSRQTLMKSIYDDDQEEENRINSDRVTGVVAARVTKDIEGVISGAAPQVLAEELANAGVPLSEAEMDQALLESQEQEQSNGSRPAGNSFPGTGAPAVPPVQQQSAEPQAGGVPVVA